MMWEAVAWAQLNTAPYCTMNDGNITAVATTATGPSAAALTVVAFQSTALSKARTGVKLLTPPSKACIPMTANVSCPCLLFLVSAIPRDLLCVMSATVSLYDSAGVLHNLPGVGNLVLHLKLETSAARWQAAIATTAVLDACHDQCIEQSDSSLDPQLLP
eukprot:355237-Chlamydomonas_euryale.AAC.4